MNLITYEDKQNLNTNPLIAEINKVTADDMNQIKNVINNLIFPIGSIIYNSDSNFNPNNVYGGTWELIDKEFVSAASRNLSFNAFTPNSDFITQADDKLS